MNPTQALGRIVTGTSLAAVLLGGAAPSYAYRMIQNTNTGRVTAGAAVSCTDTGGFTRWGTSFIQWFHNTGDQGAGKGQALRNAMASWNRAANGSHSLTWGGETTAGFATDQQNTFVWASGNGCTGNCLALTALVLQQGQVIVESDITFNDDVTWTTDGTNFDTQAVSTHELGHSLGIHHSELTASPFPTMRGTYFGLDERSLESDDVSAIRCSQTTYPPGPPTPAYLTVTSAQCHGLHDLDWGASTGATNYQLFRSGSSAFTSQSLVYSGPNRDLTVNVSGTAYYRVRACHATGCSTYRVGDRPARYVNGCF